MSSINYYIANASGKLDKLKEVIEKSFDKALRKAEIFLDIDQMDIIFSAVEDSYPLGVYGYTPGANIIYIYVDVAFNNFSAIVLESTLLHEMHHAMRWRNPGYGKNLGEAIVTEGLATLFEEETMGNVPPYAKLKLKTGQINKAKNLLESKNYDHSEWFYGSKKVDNWFGYSYGYKLCNDYSAKTGKKASELVSIPAQEILNSHIK